MNRQTMNEDMPVPPALAAYLEGVRDALLADRPDATREHLAALLQDAAVQSPAMRRLVEGWRRTS